MFRFFRTEKGSISRLVFMGLALCLGMAPAQVPTLLASIPVGPKPAAIGINRIADRVYVSADLEDRLYVLDANTNAVVTSVPVGPAPQGIAVNERDGRVYVVNVNGPTLSVLDGATNSVIATVPGFGFKPRYVAINPVTGMLYVSNQGNETGTTISVVDASSLSIVETITVSASPCDLAIDTLTNRIYVANSVSDIVTVIDGNTNSVLTAIPVGDKPTELDLNPVTGRLYVENNQGNSVSVIDITTHTVVATIPIGLGPRGVAVNDVTNQVFVGNYEENTIAYIDGNTNSLAATLPAGINPGDMVVNERTGRLYVANTFGNDVSVFGNPPPVIRVKVDVKPGSATNPVNISCNGVLPVAVLTTSVADGEPADFNASEADPATVRLGRRSAQEIHGARHLEDVDGDGDVDAVFHFRIQEVGFRCPDTSVVLVGKTFGGIDITGSDIVTVRCGN